MASWIRNSDRAILKTTGPVSRFLIVDGYGVFAVCNETVYRNFEMNIKFPDSLLSWPGDYKDISK